MHAPMHLVACSSPILLRQSSRTNCVLGATYGCSASHKTAMWVSDGCRGTFRCAQAHPAQPHVPHVHCASRNCSCGKMQDSGISTMPLSSISTEPECHVQLVEQYGTKSSCVLNSTYGCFSDGSHKTSQLQHGDKETSVRESVRLGTTIVKIWVARGCRGSFRLGAITADAVECGRFDQNEFPWTMPARLILASNCSAEWAPSLQRLLPLPSVHTIYTPVRFYAADPFPPKFVSRAHLIWCKKRKTSAIRGSGQLPYCMPLFPAGTGSVALTEMLRRTWSCTHWLCADQAPLSRLHHDHTFRNNFSMPMWDAASPPPCLFLTLRDPVARMQSGWRFRLQRSRLSGGFLLYGQDPPGITQLSAFVEAFRNKSHPHHAIVRRTYYNSVWLPQPRWMHMLVNKGDPFLIAQRDYLRGIDCNQQQLNIICTETLEADFDEVLRDYGVSTVHYKLIPNSTKVEHIKKRVSYTKGNSSLQRLAYLNEADQHYVRTVMYPWDAQLYELACHHSSAIVK